MKKTITFTAAIFVFTSLIFANLTYSQKEPEQKRVERPPEALARGNDASGSNLDVTEYNESTSLSRPSAFSLELLGRGSLYSLNYDRSLNDSMAVGGGLSFYSSYIVDVSATVLLFPVYMNYYFTPTLHRPFVTGGIDFLFATADVQGLAPLTGAFILPVFGGGYEFRMENGFLYRVAAYAFVWDKIVGTWIGISFGLTY